MIDHTHASLVKLSMSLPVAWQNDCTFTFQVWKTKAQERLAREEKEREFQRLEAQPGGKQIDEMDRW